MKAYSTARTSCGGVERLTITICPDLSKEGYPSYNNQITCHIDTKNDDESWTKNLSISNYEHTLVVSKAIVSILEKLGRTSLEYLDPIELTETLDQLKYKKVCYHEGMGRYYTKKDWPEGSVYKLEIAGQFHTALSGNTEYEALKKARTYVLKELEYSSGKKWLNWLEDPTVEFYKCGQNYYESSVQPGNTMNLEMVEAV